MPDTYDRTPITSPKWAHVRAQILAGESERSQRHAHIIDERRKEAARQQRRVAQIRLMRLAGRSQDQLPLYDQPISAWERREILGEVQTIHILRPSGRVMERAGR